jgi:hypothetical protein
MLPFVEVEDQGAEQKDYFHEVYLSKKVWTVDIAL